jgi:hypothetical protein
MPEEQHPSLRTLTSPRALIILLTLVLIISYIDRGNLATGREGHIVHPIRENGKLSSETGRVQALVMNRLSAAAARARDVDSR